MPISPENRDKYFVSGLEQAVELAMQASEFNREHGDRWRTSHGYVLNNKSTICHPTFNDGGGTARQYHFIGHPPAQYTDSGKLARFIARMCPAYVVTITRTVKEIIAERDALKHRLADTEAAALRARDLLRRLLVDKSLGVRYAEANAICHQLSAAIGEKSDVAASKNGESYDNHGGEK